MKYGEKYNQIDVPPIHIAAHRLLSIWQWMKDREWLDCIQKLLRDILELLDGQAQRRWPARVRYHMCHRHTLHSIFRASQNPRILKLTRSDL